MIVVSDTSPLTILVLFDPQHILTALLKWTLISEAGSRELHPDRAPEPIARFSGARTLVRTSRF
jgi:hypothetical protein